MQTSTSTTQDSIFKETSEIWTVNTVYLCFEDEQINARSFKPSETSQISLIKLVLSTGGAPKWLILKGKETSRAQIINIQRKESRGIWVSSLNECASQVGHTQSRILKKIKSGQIQYNCAPPLNLSDKHSTADLSSKKKNQDLAQGGCLENEATSWATRALHL